LKRQIPLLKYSNIGKNPAFQRYMDQMFSNLTCDTTKKYYFSSLTISIAFFGHSLAQMPQPLQNRRSTLSSSSIEASGQYMAHSPQALHFSWSTTGLNTRHDPVCPAAPSFGWLIARRSREELMRSSPYMPLQQL
jgi:hypothetical protein